MESMEPSTTDAASGAKPSWSYPTKYVKFTIPRIVISVAILIVIIVALAVHYGTVSEEFAGKFSLWGTPDWKIRNKGHMHQERSDSHVGKPNPKNNSWSIAAFKQSVRDLNKKANQ